jgi:hypothetical protein
MADFRRGDLVQLPAGEPWTVETTPGNAADPVSLCRTGSAGPPLAETYSAPAAQLRLVQPRDLRSLGKGTDIDHIFRQDRERQPGGWLGEILRPARTVTPAGEAQIQRAAEAASYLEQWRGYGAQSGAWARWAAGRAAQEEVLRVTAGNDPDIQAALRAPGAGTHSRHATAVAQDPIAAFARHAVQAVRAWRETDADFLNSHRAELEAADPGRFQAEAAGLWDRQAALSPVAAALAAADPAVRAAAEERREAHEFNRRLHASIGAEYGGIPDDDPSIGSLAARHAAEGVEEGDRAYDDAYDEAFARYYGQVERTWDIDGSFPAVAEDSGVSPDAASWSPPPAPETEPASLDDLGLTYPAWHGGTQEDASQEMTRRADSEVDSCAVTGHFVTTIGPTLHYTLTSTAGHVLDYWREPDGNVGVQVQAGNRWIDLATQDPRYQAVINGVREHEARNPDLAGYNNPQAASAGQAAGRAAPDPKGWTIAFRNPHANRFTRVAGLDLTWHHAVALAGVYGHLHPGQQVYYVSNAKAEAGGRVAEEDRGNILAGTGRRVKVTDREVPGVAELTETAALPEGITVGDEIRIPGQGLSLTVTEAVFYPAANLVYAAEARQIGSGANSILQVLLTPAEYAAAVTGPPAMAGAAQVTAEIPQKATGARGHSPLPAPDFPDNLAKGAAASPALPRRRTGQARRPPARRAR